MKTTRKPGPDPQLKATFAHDRNLTTLAGTVAHGLADFQDRLAEGALDSLRADLSAMLLLVDALIAFEEKTGLRPSRPVKGGGS